MFNYRSKFATTPSSFRLLRRSQVAKLYEDIERNVADAGVYQHLNHIATGRLFFPQEKFGVEASRYELRDPLPVARELYSLPLLLLTHLTKNSAALP